jgi:hypothetical protein
MDRINILYSSFDKRFVCLLLYFIVQFIEAIMNLITFFACSMSFNELVVNITYHSPKITLLGN